MSEGIPESYLNAVAALSLMPDERFELLYKGFSDIPKVIRQHYVADHVFEKLNGQIEKDVIEETFEWAISACTFIYDKDVYGTEDFTKAMAFAIQKSLSELDESKKEYNKEKLIIYLGRILALDSISHYAMALNFVVDGVGVLEVVSDPSIAVIPHPDKNKPDVGTVIVHAVQIKLMEDGEEKTINLRLDNTSVVYLTEVLTASYNRAEDLEQETASKSNTYYTV